LEVVEQFGESTRQFRCGRKEGHHTFVPSMVRPTGE
jgi:hypothetical protein